MNELAAICFGYLAGVGIYDIVRLVVAYRRSR